MTKWSLHIFVLIAIVSCKESNVNKNSIYFGGEILNPKSEFVFLMKNEKVIDSIKLDNKNSFGKYYDNLTPGLYFFQHGNEFQYIYFEPKDSINIRLNTWDFDESLVFDGIGSEKNDFLLNVFFMTERESDNFYSYFSLNENDFNEKFNAVVDRNNKMLDQFYNISPKLSSEYKYLIEEAIKYSLLRFKELYPYFHRKKIQNYDSIKPLSKTYYDFRKEVNLNDSKLSEYYTYQNYISSYLYNEAYSLNNFSDENNNFKKILTKLIIEKIKLNDLKNRLLYQETLTNVFKFENQLDSENLDLFYKHCTDSLLVKKVKNILIAKELLPIQSNFPNLKLIDISNNKITTNQIINNQPTVFYFWLNEKNSQEFVYKRINFLSNKFPEIQFIGISRNKQFHLNKNAFKNQYYMDDLTINLFSDDFPRTIIVDKNGKVVHNFSLLSNNHIEKSLDKLVPNKKTLSL